MATDRLNDYDAIAESMGKVLADERLKRDISVLVKALNEQRIKQCNVEITLELILSNADNPVRDIPAGVWINRYKELGEIADQRKR